MALWIFCSSMIRVSLLSCWKQKRRIKFLVGKEQAREYAKSLYLKYVILSNGNQHYFWNIYKGNPQLITAFPSYESIRESKAMNADPAKLYSEEIGADYIAVIKNPRYMEAPRVRKSRNSSAIFI